MRYVIEFEWSGPRVCNLWLTEKLGSYRKGNSRRKLASSWHCDSWKSHTSQWANVLCWRVSIVFGWVICTKCKLMLSPSYPPPIHTLSFTLKLMIIFHCSYVQGIVLNQGLQAWEWLGPYFFPLRSFYLHPPYLVGYNFFFFSYTCLHNATCTSLCL